MKTSKKKAPILKLRWRSPIKGLRISDRDIPVEDLRAMFVKQKLIGEYVKDFRDLRRIRNGITLDILLSEEAASLFPRVRRVPAFKLFAHNGFKFTLSRGTW